MFIENGKQFFVNDIPLTPFAKLKLWHKGDLSGL
jgi:hypothetical protein